jgi:homoserine dehydrogenase
MAATGVEMFNPNEDSGSAADGLAAVKVAMELGGDINGVGIGHGWRPTAAAALRDLMRARGMEADLEEDPNLYTFGVTAR